MKTLKELYFSKQAKKLSTKDLRSLIMEVVNEDADPSKVDPERFPMKLSQAAAKADQADALVTMGTKDGSDADDKVGASSGELAVTSLKPSQSSMNIEKACQFAICAILEVKPFQGGPGGDLGAIITSDDHIMDGHHRWIATGMVDPGASVGGYVVEFPAKEMIAALNMITVKLGITSGKPGSGGFDQFNEAGILPVLQKLVKEGFWGADAEQCQQACEEFSEETGEAAVAAAAKKMGDNVSKLTLSVPSGFPERPDMPVISKGKGHLEQAIKLLQTGAVDLNEPYADEGAEKKEESRRNEGDLIMERWKRMAGLL